MHVAQHDPHPLLAAQHFLVAALHAELADVVAALVVRVGVHVRLVHLRHVAQQVRGQPRHVPTHRTLLDRETIETKQLLAKLRKLVRRYLAHEELRRVARIAEILRRVFDFRHSADIFFARDAHRPAEVGRVDPVLILHRHQDVVRGLIVHQQLPVPIGDQPARGVQDLFAKRVGVRALAIVLVHQLQRQQSQHEHDNDRQRDAADHQLALLKTIILGHGGREIGWGRE